MSLFGEISAVSSMNLAALPSRASASLVTVIGVAAVIAVMLSLLGLGEGVLNSVQRNDQPNRVVVLSSGASDYMGSFSRADVAQIAEAPGIKRDAAGRPMVQPYATVVVELENRAGNGTSNVAFTGSGEIGQEMNQSTFHLIAGREFTPGLHELIVGKVAQQRFRNLSVGDTVKLRNMAWKVVGSYEDSGRISERAITADADTILAAFNRTSYQNVGVELDSPASFRAFKDTVTSNPQLRGQVQVKRLSQYYRDQLKPLTALLSFVGYFVGGVMALGAVFGALNTMYSAVDARKREIATLRALGFGGAAVVISVMLEALVLAVPGALLGAAVAWLLFNNHNVAMAGASFAVDVTPGLIVVGVIWALAIGLIGGFAPAIRAARLPVADALRAT
jgi:putative ABC transport system permease protein